MKSFKNTFNFATINDVINAKIKSPKTTDGRNLILYITQITQSSTSTAQIIKIISEGNLLDKNKGEK